MKKVAAILFLVVLASCKKDKPEPEQPEVPVVVQPSQQRVFVVNEGKFGGNSATISLYNVATGESTKEYYQAQNNNQSLGDVAQSMVKIGERYYIVMNNSQKIVVCDKDMKKIAEAGSMPSPRYILPVSETKAYVTDMVAGKVHILDLVSNTISGSIVCKGWTEDLVKNGNEVYVLNEKTGKMVIINSTTDKITDSVFVGDNAANIELDKNGKVWVMSQGDYASIPAQLWKVDPSSRSVELKLLFSSADFPGNLCLNKTKDTLLYLNNGVWRMPVTATSKPGAAFISSGTRKFYGLGVNPANYSIYVSDAIDYAQSSTIYIYDNAGNEKSFFKAGINANSFYFE